MIRMALIALGVVAVGIATRLAAEDAWPVYAAAIPVFAYAFWAGREH